MINNRQNRSLKRFSLHSFLSVVITLSGCSATADWADPDKGLPVKYRMTNLGEVFADNEGKSLYTFSKDIQNPGESSCNGKCATIWPPLLAGPDSHPSGDFSLIARISGEKQWAYHGMPLYRFAKDKAAGDTNGEGVKDVWFVAQPFPISKYNTIAEGVAYTDYRLMTLYVLDNEYTNQLVCKNACLEAWPPLYANKSAVDRGDFSVFVNLSGKRQWAFKDRPLYLWQKDKAPGETSGQGIEHPSGGLWQTAKPY